MPRETLTREVMDAFRSIVQMLRTSHRAAANVDITGAQLFVLSILADSDSAVSVGDLAEKTRTDPSTVSVVVSRLVERGLVKRERAGDDARRTSLSLTPKGRALRRRAPQTVAQRKLAEALEDLNERDLAALQRILATIVSEMGAGTAKPPMLFDDGPARRSRRNQTGR